MSNACEVCGYRNSEVKPGGGFSDHGTQITLQVLTTQLPGYQPNSVIAWISTKQWHSMQHTNRLMLSTSTVACHTYSHDKAGRVKCA